MSASTQDQKSPSIYTQRAKSIVVRYRWWLAGLLGLVVLFGLLGYFWLPGFAKGKVEALLSEKLHRPVTIEQIEVHPYSLEATIHGFRIGALEGDDALLKFESLYVNLSSLSVARAAPVINAVRLTAPEIHLSRDGNGRLSIADLIEEAMSQPASEGQARFSVSNIQIEGGRFEFDDKLKQSHQRITDINVGVPFVASFSSSEDVWVQPHFSARINDGSTVSLEGQVLPFADTREAQMSVDLKALDLTGLDEYAPEVKGIKLHSALLDTKLTLAFAQGNNQPAAVKVNGDVTLSNMDVDNTAGLPWRLKGETVTLHLKDIEPLLMKTVEASLEARNLKFRQGDRPEMVLDTLSITDARADIAGHTASFILAAKINNRGTLDTSGQLGWAPLSADLDVTADKVDIVALQGWIGDYPNAMLTKGAASFKGKVKLADAPMNVMLSGNAQLSDLNVLDRLNSLDLLSFKSLDVGNMAIQTSPLRVDIETVSLADYFARVMITPDGKLNFNSVVAQQRADVTESVVSKPKENAAKAPVEPERTAALPIHIGRITLQGGHINFNDRFIKPNYRVNLTGVGGTIGPLDPGKPGLVDLRGALAKSAPLELKGKVDPFGKEVYLDVTAKAKGIDLPGFSPYSGRYVGYAIEKGKLSVDLHYFIEKSQLRAENHIFLDQLTFGEKIESPDALSLPVNLAVSLLKNSRGEIDLDVPVSGSLNDPEFSIGGVIFKVIINLITKAVTAPFALLGSMFGGGADLSQIDFVPGYARLTPEAEKSLEAVSKAMLERPALKLEVTGVADSANDREGLKRALLERRVKSQKLAALAKKGESGGSVSGVEVSAAEYPKYLELAYKAEKFDKPTNFIGMNKSLPVPDMEQLMLANMPADDDAMRGLAERRARFAYEALLEKGVPTERVFILQPKVESAADGKKLVGRVEFSLR